MKNVLFIVLVSIFVITFASIVYSQTSGYVNLGLPSGTLWKEQNENGYYSYESAARTFRDQLPTKTQIEELISTCQWSWTGNGYRVVGPNGKSIFLSAAGFRHCDGKANEVPFGYYWSCTVTSFGDSAWTLGFYNGGGYVGSNIFVECGYKCNRGTVRLVK